ncbi:MULTISPECIES: mechanosensitive ion channel family protein [Halorussus]|uniref:mechanosensitive ion channel family protein n=1 Tax=Halorussus TaxID=1070314 RepID=UPI00209C7A29|nr:mechanosensitive ion channel domain-containing protein [Halorussus vallis]USZ75515.1 mechanosensitive ion channel family protein [Halorussus vallis]
MLDALRRAALGSTGRAPSLTDRGVVALLQDGGGGFEWPTTTEELIAEFGGLIGDVIAFVLAFVVVYFVGRYLLVNLVDRTMRARGIDETVRQLATRTAGAVALFVAVAVAFTVAGFGAFLAAFATLGGALALAAGFAAQDLVANFVAGVFILKDEPFEVGDWIEWSDYAGVVREIDLRVTKVETFNNEVVTVPNSELANNPVTNPMANEKLRMQFTFGIGYDDDIDEAADIIVADAESCEEILSDPAPSVRTTELADSYVGLESRIWIDDPGRGKFKEVLSEHVEGVKERFDAEGVEMPYPYRELTGGIGIEEVNNVDQVRVTGD